MFGLQNYILILEKSRKVKDKMISKFGKGFIPARAVIWIMIFTCTFFIYMVRINLSILLLAMVDSKDENGTSIVKVPECKRNISFENGAYPSTEISLLPDYGERYHWDKKLQGIILGSYFWGFTISGIPGGALAEKFGPTKIVTISFVTAGFLTLLGPVVSNWSPILLIITRFLIGLVGGVIYPCLHCLVARWVPPNEKGKFMGALMGGSLGTISTWPMLGAIIEQLGWIWGFYINGAMVLIWTIFWLLLVADHPAEHRLITESEKNYIESSLGNTISKKKKKLPPYKDMVLSKEFWAFIILHFGNLWGLFFLMTAGPNYVSSVLGFNIGKTGFLAPLPSLARMIFAFIFGWIGDFIRKRNLMRTTTIRKFFIIFSHFLPGLLLIAQTAVGCDVTLALVLITLSLGSNGASTLTNLQNSQDLAPNFAGSLYGIANCIGSTSGFLSPLLVGFLTEKNNGLHEWHLIFSIGAIVYIACGIVFCVFGSGEVQPWNDKEALSDGQQVQNEMNGIENKAFDEEKM